MRFAVRLWSRYFTMARWKMDYPLLWPICFLAAFSLSQLLFGASEGTIQAEHLDPRTVNFLATSNLLGALVALTGLHFRNEDRGSTWELYGYASLLGTMVIWVGLLIATSPVPNTSYGLGFGEAFVFATFHRLWFLVGYRRARRREDDLKLKLAAAVDDPEVR